jgi:hypothetical protein
MAIEILENTLLKLLVRRGTDFDRKQIILTTGELGYATDTERLYIGNSTDAGGILVGNKWKGSTADLTTLAGVITGDYAYDTSTNTLNVLIAGTGSNASDWYTVADQISASNDTINFSVNNGITVGTLSAGNFNADALGDSIELDGSNRIALSGSVNIDQVSIRDTTSDSYLTLPQRIKINPVQSTVYSFPAGSPSNNDFLRSDGNGTLRWAPYQVIETTVSPTTAAVIPVASIVPFASGANQIPYGWLECDGTSYAGATYKDLSGVIGNAYGGDDVNFNVPNLVDKVLYGSPVDPPVNSNLMGVVTGANPDFPGLSATGMNYIIKAINGVTNPTFTVRDNLSCFVNSVDKTGVAFDPLSGNVVIERPAPGMVTYSNTGEYSFTIPAGVRYMKFHVTGSGANGGINTGGAAATVIGNISAAPGTVFTVCVASAPPAGQGSGCASNIKVGSTVIAASYGGCYASELVGAAGALLPGTPGPGLIATGEPQVLNGHVFLGGWGGLDTGARAHHESNSGYQEAEGAASYWGSAPSPGAGTGAHAACGMGNASDGLVMFEWN